VVQISFAGQFTPRPINRFCEHFDSRSEFGVFAYLKHAQARPRKLYDPIPGPGSLAKRIDFELPGVQTYDGYSPFADGKGLLSGRIQARDFDDLVKVARYNGRILLLISIYERIAWRTTREGGLLAVPHWFRQDKDGFIQLWSLQSGRPWDDLWWEAEPGILERAYDQARADIRSTGPQILLPGLTAQS
jgi:hypothetical protein